MIVNAGLSVAVSGFSYDAGSGIATFATVDRHGLSEIIRLELLRHQVLSITETLLSRMSLV